jgi:hypothetical protein
LSTQTCVMVGATRLALRSSVRKAARSCTSAAVRTAAISKPAESTSRWCLTPSALLAPWKPRGPATGDALTEDASTTAAVGRRCRPERVRTSPRIAVSTVVHVPARYYRWKCLCAADALRVKSCGRCGHAHPVRSTYRMASRYSRRRWAGHGRSPGGWLGTTNPAMRAQAVSDRSARYRRRRAGSASHESRW